MNSGRLTPDEYLKESTKIESFAIEEEFIRLPGDLAYWNEQYSQAYARWQMAKLDLEQHEASASIAIRDDLELTRKGRVTVGEVEQTLRCSEPYMTFRRQEISTETEKVRLHGVLDAIRAKRDMLISLGAHMRLEMSHDPTIRRQERIAREVDEHRRP